MCLINCGLGSLSDRKEIQMAFFLSSKAPRSDFRLHGEVPRDTTDDLGRNRSKNKSVADGGEVKVALPLETSEGRRKFPPRSDVPRTSSFGRGAARA
jgi:hypothetical protein